MSMRVDAIDMLYLEIQASSPLFVTGISEDLKAQVRG